MAFPDERVRALSSLTLAKRLKQCVLRQWAGGAPAMQTLTVFLHICLSHRKISISVRTRTYLGVFLIVPEFQQQILFLLTQLSEQVLLYAGVHEVASHLRCARQVAPD